MKRAIETELQAMKTSHILIEEIQPASLVGFLWRDYRGTIGRADFYFQSMNFSIFIPFDPEDGGDM
jgi:hypothetical protein